MKKTIGKLLVLVILLTVCLSSIIYAQDISLRKEPCPNCNGSNFGRTSHVLSHKTTSTSTCPTISGCVVSTVTSHYADVYSCSDCKYGYSGTSSAVTAVLHSLH